MKLRLAMLFVLVYMFPAVGNAVETRSVKVKALTVVAETEGPYVEDTAKQAFALPSGETAVNMDKASWGRLVASLGEPGVPLKKDVVITYYASPGVQDIYDDCKGHLAKIQSK